MKNMFRIHIVIVIVIVWYNNWSNPLIRALLWTNPDTSAESEFTGTAVLSGLRVSVTAV